VFCTTDGTDVVTVPVPRLSVVVWTPETDSIDGTALAERAEADKVNASASFKSFVLIQLSLY